MIHHVNIGFACAGDAGLGGGRLTSQMDTDSSVTSFLAPIGGVDDFDVDNDLGLPSMGNRV